MTDQQKTEQPTQKKIDETKSKGSFPHSKEFLSFIMTLAYIISCAWYIPDSSREIALNLKTIFESAGDLVQTRELLYEVVILCVKLFAFPIGITFLFFAMFGNVLQTGFHVSMTPIMPSVSKISIGSGLKRLFSTQSLMELLNSVMKISIVMCVLYFVISSNFKIISNSYLVELYDSCLFFWQLIKSFLVKTIICLFFVAVLDVLYKRMSFIDSLKMTKEEVKQEFKDSEGNPEIKSKLRKLRTQNLITSLQNVESADFVIVNPDHYAVALKYDSSMPAPKVVGKGQNYLALKIKKIAYENSIFVVQNKILARAIYDEVKIGAYIHEKFYRAVAEIVRYLYNLRNKSTNQ